MCAHCSFPADLQIRIHPIGTSALLLCRAGENLPSQAVRESEGHFNGILDGDWMFIRHPHPAVGLVGLPLLGERGSWQSAFEDMRVDLSIRVSGTGNWRMIESWNELPLVLVRS